MNRVSTTIAPPSWTYRLQILYLQVLLQSVSIVAWSSSANLLDCGLQLHLQTCSIMASKCISNVAQSQLPIASPNSLNCSLQLHLQTCSIAACMWISKLTPLRPPSASPNPLHQGLWLYRWVHSIMIFRSTATLGNIEWVFHIMRCLSTPESPNIYCLLLSPSLLFLYLQMYIYRET